MGHSVVASDDFPYLSIRVAVRDWEVHQQALIDTGFTGDLVVPEGSLPQDIGNPDHVRVYRVADDRFTRAPMFTGELEVMGLPLIQDVTVAELGSRYLIGLGIIERYVVTLERGERVIIEG